MLVQLEKHVSLSILFPSSHSSSASTILFPQTTGRGIEIEDDELDTGRGGIGLDEIDELDVGRGGTGFEAIEELDDAR